MMSIQDKKLFINALNKSFRHKAIITEDEFVMTASLEARLMAPSKAKQIIKDAVSEGLVKKKDRFIDISGLYDMGKREYVLRSESTGKVLKTAVSKPAQAPKRTVKYAGPGHTVVGYAHRTLHIKFKETKQEYEARRTARRKAAARNRTHDDSIYVEHDESGNMTYVSKSGRASEQRARSRADKGNRAITAKNLSKDGYTIEDMRALLRDDHWEEVCGNRRWNYDDKATVQEFRRYLRRRKRM